MSKPPIPKLEKQTTNLRLKADEAVSAYLDVQKWQSEHVKGSTAQADAGRLIDHAEIKKMASHLRRRK